MLKSFFLFTAIILLIFSCKSERQQRIEEAAEEMEEAAEQIAEAAEQMAEEMEESIEENAENMAEAMEKFGEAMAGNSKVKAINYRELKTSLPKEAAGLPKQKSSGESNAAMGINISEVEGLYFNEDEDPEIKIKIIDMGNMSGFMKLGSIGWAISEFDRESGSGFERTSKIDGHKAFEEYDSDLQRGQIQIIVAKRFLVEIRGRDIRFKAIKETASDFDFSELLDLAEDAVIN
ncbi:MAG: hypothetical protein D8M58_03890 [Calditrichaeota bacterium]|nr:MAG: hypothetical protein DWQ03_03185 [Calditrichota bacterium]MBL1204509.1 hypothetical protein [Calditrichota bacterium]NOG44338.1 hypothetical protein [Calditrichota bacterium]